MNQDPLRAFHPLGPEFIDDIGMGDGGSSDSSDDDFSDEEDIPDIAEQLDAANGVDRTYDNFEEFRALMDQFRDEGAPGGDPVPPSMSHNSDPKQVDHFRFMKKNITLQEVSTATWTNLKIEHRIPDQAERDIRLYHEVLSNTNTETCKPLLPGGIKKGRSTLLDVTGLEIARHGRCPDNCVAYDSDDEATLVCPQKGCGKPRFKVRIHSNIFG